MYPFYIWASSFAKTAVMCSLLLATCGGALCQCESWHLACVNSLSATTIVHTERGIVTYKHASAFRRVFASSRGGVANTAHNACSGGRHIHIWN